MRGATHERRCCDPLEALYPSQGARGRPPPLAIRRKLHQRKLIVQVRYHKRFFMILKEAPFVHLSHVHAYGRYLSTVLRGVAAAMALAMAYSCKPNVLAPIQLIHDTPCLSTCAPRRISYFALSIAAPRFASELQASRGCSCLASDMSASSSVHRWLSNDSCVAVLARIASSLSSCS